MATGYTTTGSLADSLDDIRSSARIVREYEGVMPRLCDKKTLGEGIGLSWQEVSFSQMTAQAITENTKLNNPQQMEDSLLTVTPTVVGIHYVVTDRVRARLNRKALAQTGSLGQNAIQRKKDEDGLTMLDGATTSLCGTGTTLASGYVFAAVTRITGNVTEPGPLPIYCVLHGYGIKDILDEIVSGIGTYAIPSGLTADTFRQGFKGSIGGAELYEDGNITVDSTPDAKGGVFSREGLVLVQGRAPRVVTVRDEALGGGADVVYIYDEYAYGERSAGNWVYEIQHDATAPTS